MRTTTYEVPDVNSEQSAENYEPLSTTTPTTGHEKDSLNVDRTSNVDAYEAMTHNAVSHCNIPSNTSGKL